MTKIPEPIELDKPICPHCGEEEQITKIYRPEVYEYAYICRRCDRGFNMHGLNH